MARQLGQFQLHSLRLPQPVQNIKKGMHLKEPVEVDIEAAEEVHEALEEI